MSNQNIKTIYANVLAAVGGRLTEPVGRTVLVPGLDEVWDDCCDGQLYLKQVEVFPTASAGAAFPALDPVQSCGPLLLALHLEVGVIRCAAVVDDQGNAPDPALITADALLQTDDWQSVLDALVIDVPRLPYVQRTKLDKWVPKQTQGGCAGGGWSFYLAVDPGVNCETPA